MVGYNVKIQEFHNGEVKFSIYPDGINYIPDEFKSYVENERIERRLQALVSIILIKYSAF